jgi:hypothetical protein
MPIQEAAFWVGSEMFFVGIYSIFEGNHLLASVIFMILGLAGMAYSVFKYHNPPPIRKRVWIPFLAFNLCLLGFVIYVRHRVPVPFPSPNILTPTEIYIECRPIILPSHSPHDDSPR